MTALTPDNIEVNSYIKAQVHAYRTGSRADQSRAMDLLRDHLRENMLRAAFQVGIELDRLSEYVDAGARMRAGMRWLAEEAEYKPHLVAKAKRRVNELWRIQRQIEARHGDMRFVDEG